MIDVCLDIISFVVVATCYVLYMVVVFTLFMIIISSPFVASCIACIKLLERRIRGERYKDD